jgi:hypothetical protein
MTRLSHEDSAKAHLGRLTSADAIFTDIQRLGPAAVAYALLAVNDTLRDIAGYLDDTSWREAQEEDE